MGSNCRRWLCPEISNPKPHRSQKSPLSLGCKYSKTKKLTFAPISPIKLLFKKISLALKVNYRHLSERKSHNGFKFCRVILRDLNVQPSQMNFSTYKFLVWAFQGQNLMSKQYPEPKANILCSVELFPCTIMLRKQGNKEKSFLEASQTLILRRSLQKAEIAIYTFFFFFFSPLEKEQQLTSCSDGRILYS